MRPRRRAHTVLRYHSAHYDADAALRHPPRRTLQEQTVTVAATGRTFVRFGLSEDQQLLLDTAEHFLSKELPATAVREWTRRTDGDEYRRWWRNCGALGWSGIFAPDGFHGFGSVSGKPLIDAAIVAEVSGRALAPSPLAGASVGAFALGLVGRISFSALDEVLAGTHIAGYAAEEAGGSWEHAELNTVARRDGDHVVLNGQKINVPDACTADIFIVTCRMDDLPCLVVVPADAEGVSTQGQQSLDLLRSFGDLRLDAVRVPAAALLSSDPRETSHVDTARHLATCLHLAEAVGAVDRLLAMLVDYARTRYAFGRPIGGFQALKHRIADLTLWVESCKGTVDAAVDAVSEGSSESDLLVSVAKAYVGDRSIRIAQECTQMFGGIGLTWEHDAHLYLRRVTSCRALLGTPEQHRLRVARILDAASGAGGKSGV